MAPKRKLRKVNHAIFVFCEGETEQKYIDILRKNFRIPIQIVTKVLNTKISQRLVDAYIKACGYPDVDKVFLFYDGDRQDVMDRLYNITNAEVMLSCPCIELWFLLHFTSHSSHLTSDQMVKSLIKHFPSYKKGLIQNQLEEILLNNWKAASLRAKTMQIKTNPSTTAYILPEYLETLRKLRRLSGKMAKMAFLE